MLQITNTTNIHAIVIRSSLSPM